MRNVKKASRTQDASLVRKQAQRREGQTPSVIYGNRSRKPDPGIDEALSNVERILESTALDTVKSKSDHESEADKHIELRSALRRAEEQSITSSGKLFARLCDLFVDYAEQHDLGVKSQVLFAEKCAAYARALVAQLSVPSIPDNAPELWSERNGRTENPAAFIRRVYGTWLSNGLIRPHIKELDPPLYNALGVWCHRNPDDTLPELPTLSEHIDGIIDDLSDLYSEEELRKLGLALQMRHRKSR